MSVLHDARQAGSDEIAAPFGREVTESRVEDEPGLGEVNTYASGVPTASSPSGAGVASGSPASSSGAVSAPSGT
jgi:hypothetical protein